MTLSRKKKRERRARSHGRISVVLLDVIADEDGNLPCLERQGVDQIDWDLPATLFPGARQGERWVVCMRAARSVEPVEIVRRLAPAPSRADLGPAPIAGGRLWRDRDE